MHNKWICLCFPITGLDKPLALQEFEATIISRQKAHEDVKPKHRCLYTQEIPVVFVSHAGYDRLLSYCCHVII